VPPGGKIEPGETPREAAVRELLEDDPFAVELRGGLLMDHTIRL
jgi:ADP-ribose pyrophosphatase YjhB (NUDIX family)